VLCDKIRIIDQILTWLIKSNLINDYLLVQLYIN
jgi:SOS response regulatory protein OraA/RecX